MQIDTITIDILLVVFISTIFRAAFGFGGALISVPLLSFWISIEMAVALSVLITTTVAAVIVAYNWRKIHLRSVGWLLLFTFIGIPAGLLLLLYVNEQIVKIMLGIFITSFSIYLLTGRKLKELETENMAWLIGCGLSAGVFGGAYGLNGPPLIIYGAKRRWDSHNFRASLQAYFLISSIVTIIGYGCTGLLTKHLMHYYALSLPVLIPSVLLGNLIHNRLHRDAFLKYVYSILLAMGLLMLFKSVF